MIQTVGTNNTVIINILLSWATGMALLYWQTVVSVFVLVHCNALLFLLVTGIPNIVLLYL